MVTQKRSANVGALVRFSTTSPVLKEPSNKPLNSYSDFAAFCATTQKQQGNNLLGLTVHYIKSSPVYIEHGMTKPKCYTATIISVTRVECSGPQNTGISVNLSWTDERGGKTTEAGVVYQGYPESGSTDDPWGYPNFHIASHNPQLYPPPFWHMSAFPPGTVIEGGQQVPSADAPPSATYTGCAGITDSSISDGATTWICWCKGKETYRQVTPLGQTLDGAAITAAHGACQDQATSGNSEFFVSESSLFPFTARAAFVEYNPHSVYGDDAWGARASIKIIDINPPETVFSPLGFSRCVIQYVKLNIGEPGGAFGQSGELKEIVMAIVHLKTQKYVSWWVQDLQHRVAQPFNPTSQSEPLRAAILGKIILSPSALNTVQVLGIQRKFSDPTGGTLFGDATTNFEFTYGGVVFGTWSTEPTFAGVNYAEVGIVDHASYGSLVIPTHDYTNFQKISGRSGSAYTWTGWSGRDGKNNSNNLVIDGTWLTDTSGRVTYVTR